SPNGFPLRQHLRRFAAGGVRAAAAGRDGGRADAVHAARRGRGGMAMGHAHPQLLVQGDRGSPAHLRRGRMGTSGSGSPDRIDGTTMAAPLTERIWRTSAPATIERDLAELWRDVCAKGPVARAIMSNLVIVRAARVERRAGVSIDAVAGQHPSGGLIIDHEQPGSGPCEITGARVGVVTYGPPEARYGVEQVAVRSACTDESLPALIRRLVRGERPISVWCAEDLSNVPLLASIVDMGRQLVYDSRQWASVGKGVQALEPWQHLDLADVNWGRPRALRRPVL